MTGSFVAKLQKDRRIDRQIIKSSLQGVDRTMWPLRYSPPLSLSFFLALERRSTLLI